MRSGELQPEVFLDGLCIYHRQYYTTHTLTPGKPKELREKNITSSGQMKRQIDAMIAFRSVLLTKED